MELWDVKHTPHLDRVFMKEDEESIESVAWCGERLFISGMTGSVIELDLLNLSIKVFCYLFVNVATEMPIVEY